MPVDSDAGTDARLSICVVCQPDAVVMKLDASGSTLWAKHFGDDGADAARAVKSSSGYVIVAGTVEGSVDFGGGNTTSTGEGDAFVLALDGSGAYLWARRFSGTGDDDAYGVVLDPSGNIFVVGSFAETLSIRYRDAFESRANGCLRRKTRCRRAAALGEAARRDRGIALALGVAADGQGAVILVGADRGRIDAGGGALDSAFNDRFVVKLDGDGNHVFSRRLGGAQNDEADAVAVDGQGRVIVTGAVGSDVVDFGGGPISGGRSDDLFVVTLDPDGEHECSRRYGSGDASSGGLGLAVDSNGNAVIAGAFSGTVDFGAGRLSSTGGLDVLLAKFLD